MTPPGNERSNNIHFESKKYTECRTGSIRDLNKFLCLSFLLFGGGPNRVMETACFDANVQ